MCGSGAPTAFPRSRPSWGRPSGATLLRCSRRRRAASSPRASEAWAWMLLPSRLEDDLDAVVLLVLERLVAVGCHVEAQAVRDDEARVDVTVLDVVVEGLQVALDVALARLQGQPLVHPRARG